MELTVFKFELRAGGVFHYLMQAGEKKMYGRIVYREITPPERLAFVNSFADQGGNIVRAPFLATFPLEVLNVLTFTEENGRTTLTLRGGPINASEEERNTYKGFFDSMQKGFGATFDKLVSYLAEIMGK